MRDSDLFPHRSLPTGRCRSWKALHLRCWVRRGLGRHATALQRNRLRDDSHWKQPVTAAATKIAANAGIPIIIEMLTEQLRIAARYNVPEARLIEVLLGVDYENRLIRRYGPMIAERRFDPLGFPVVLGRKDVGLAPEQ